MSQLTATFMKTATFFVRNRALLLGIVVWPMALMVLMASTELGSVSSSDMPLALGGLTISMVGFALMLACIMNLPGSIARDREIGLLVKLRSMPISPGIDTLGRLLAYLVFAVVVAGLVTLLGLGLGARFSGGVTADLEAVGFLLMAVVAAAGCGLILGSLIKSVQGIAFFGLAVALILAFVSGIFVPYSQLSSPLQAFSRAFPISSATASVSYLLLGQDVAGYDPLTLGQIATGVAVSLVLLVIGLVLYHRTSWRQVSGTPSSPLGGFRRMRHQAKSGA
jgi:ABC-2 type transport system permease protein